MSTVGYVGRGRLWYMGRCQEAAHCTLVWSTDTKSGLRRKLRVRLDVGENSSSVVIRAFGIKEGA